MQTKLTLYLFSREHENETERDRKPACQQNPDAFSGNGVPVVPAPSRWNENLIYRALKLKN